MNLPRVVVDNSAVLPAFFPEAGSSAFDAGLVTNRAVALVHAIRMRRVSGYVPPSFYREFLNVATRPMNERGGRSDQIREEIRAQWEDLLSLPLVVVPLQEIIHHAGTLALDDFCPAADAWYVAAAVHARATFWMSHDHTDGLVAVASRHVAVRLLSKEAPNY